MNKKIKKFIYGIGVNVITMPITIKYWMIRKSPIIFLRWHQYGYQRYGTTDGMVHSLMLFGVAVWIIPSRFNVFRLDGSNE